MTTDQLNVGGDELDATPAAIQELLHDLGVNLSPNQAQALRDLLEEAGSVAEACELLKKLEQAA